MVRLLVDHGAEVDSQDNRKVSCLMASFRKVQIPIMCTCVSIVACSYVTIYQTVCLTSPQALPAKNGESLVHLIMCDTIGRHDLLHVDTHRSHPHISELMIIWQVPVISENMPLVTGVVDA